MQFESADSVALSGMLLLQVLRRGLNKQDVPREEKPVTGVMLAEKGVRTGNGWRGEMGAGLIMVLILGEAGGRLQSCHSVGERICRQWRKCRVE